MDIYLLSRLFRSFNVENISHPYTLDNAIIFAGGIHTTTYEIFLQRLGFDEVYAKGNFESNYDDITEYLSGSNKKKYLNKEIQCLDINDLPRPLFSK